MPWKVEKKGSRYFVENKMTGRVAGSHKTEKEAEQQVKALYANMDETLKNTKTTVHMSGGTHKVPAQKKINKETA